MFGRRPRGRRETVYNRAILRDLIAGIGIGILTTICFFVVAAGLIALFIPGPPVAAKLAIAAGTAVFLLAGTVLARRSWPLLLRPGEDAFGPARSPAARAGHADRRATDRARAHSAHDAAARAGAAAGAPSARELNESAAHGPLVLSTREKFALLAQLESADRRVVVPYLIIGLPAVFMGLAAAVVAFVAGIIRLTGGLISVTWVPPWLPVLLQVVSLVGVVTIGVRGHRDRQVRFVAVAMPIILAVFGAVIRQEFVVPGVVLAVTLVISIAYGILGRRAARGPA